MIAAWMLYCSVLGMLLAGAAQLVERVVERAGGPTRRVWAWALAAAVAVPLVGVMLRDAAPVDDRGVRAALDPVAGALMHGVDSLATLDRSLGALWAVGSVAGLMLLAGAVLRTLARARRWRRASVDGVPVLVSHDVGPAVVGFVRGRIVLPAWALDAPAEERAMMLRHEQEHLAAGDHRLTLLGLLLVSAMPWNPALWYLAHRARLAIEVDCDRRVVRGGGIDVRAYGSLLISVGRRRGAHALAAAAFSWPRSTLEHRIDRMTLPCGGGGRWRSAALGMAAALVLAGAWALPQPVRAADVSNEVVPCPEQEREAPVLPVWPARA